MMKAYELSASDISRHLIARELSSVEVVRSLIERREAVDGGVNAFVHRFDEQALRQAELCDQKRTRGEAKGALFGLPITVKENIATAGSDSTVGLKSRVGTPASEDAVAVRLAREAGAIVIGKTNVPQTLLAFETVNFIWGTTNNPWQLARTPGGSSGGEAAAIASGSSVLGIGSDIGGSIRIPAAFTGVAGLKPTEHRWSNRGSMTAIAGQEAIRSQVGPLGRTAEDVSLLFTALPSPLHAAHDPFVAPVPLRAPSEVAVNRLRIGFYEDDGFLAPSLAIRRAVREAVRALGNAGAEIVEYRPPKVEEAVYLFFAILSSDAATTLDRLIGNEEVIAPLKMVRRVAHLPAAGRKALARAASLAGEKRIARMLDVLGRKPVEDLWALTNQRALLRFDEMAAWDRDRLDALVCPVLATPAVQHGASADFSLGAASAQRYNLLNLPAGSVAVTRVRADECERPAPRDRLEKRAASVDRGSAGLPVAVQVVARPWAEEVVLAVMMAIEKAARAEPGFPKTPIDPVRA